MKHWENIFQEALKEIFLKNRQFWGVKSLKKKITIKIPSKIFKNIQQEVLTNVLKTYALYPGSP